MDSDSTFKPNTTSTIVGNRYKAAFLHFLLSCLVFSAFILTLLYLWYPSPYFSASGGWQGLRLVALVDLVLGPLLTLIVFNTGKKRKELVTDLTIIFVFQLSALVWGIYTVYQERPVVAAFWSGSFYTVPAKSLLQQGEHLQQLRQFGDRNPVYVYAQPPISEQEHEEMLQEVAEFDVPPYERMHRYRPLQNNFAEIRRANLNIDEIITNNAQMAESLQEILLQSETGIDDNYYISLVSRYRNIVLVFSAAGDMLGMLNAPLKQDP